MTPEEMRAVDAAAPDPVDVLVGRAGAALARAALDVLGGAYGRRVVVVAGKGNNGADGRDAGRRLAARGVRVQVLEAADAPEVLPRCDLVIDAAYGTGFRGVYRAPDPGGAFVLAADIPSGVDGLTGAACDGAVVADATVTFAALKPGLLLADGATSSGAVSVADIGLDVSGSRSWLVEGGDVASRLPRRPRDAHKYWAAVLAVAGSPGMTGAAHLTASAAMRAGSGYCRLAVPGADPRVLPASEVVTVTLPAERWAAAALDACDRMAAAAIGPGLGRDPATQDEVRAFVTRCPLPLVVDADALVALGDRAGDVLGARRAPTVLTPHAGEYQRVAGEAPGPDRIGAARALASRLGVTVLLKGPLTVVADADGTVHLSDTGGPALATAGTGDVLTGVIAAFCAMGMRPLDAAALGACVHGLAGRRGPEVGLVAGDVVEALPWVVSEVGA
ncbi:MAG TPA: NAD(P)H-hydrate dehydratase [Acidimicrobiales bacterium]|nr:NAD(P)H-hydrate dehydratase [Acidimicrobiales bacterium]